MIGSKLIGDLEQKTNIKFENIGGFEIYNNAIDVDYDSEDKVFTRWFCKINTPEFNRVNRSHNGRGTVFKQDFVEDIGNNFYIPTSGNCFLKSINHLTGKY